MNSGFSRVQEFTCEYNNFYKSEVISLGSYTRFVAIERVACGVPSITVPSAPSITLINWYFNSWDRSIFRRQGNFMLKAHRQRDRQSNE